MRAGCSSGEQFGVNMSWVGDPDFEGAPGRAAAESLG
jgi:hypothetical protein